MKMFKELVTSCWSCPAFDKAKQKCSKLGEFIPDEVVDRRGIDPRCKLEDVTEKDWKPL